jgi:putative tryptophan/tyrosine transport system substrate-binding protein
MNKKLLIAMIVIVVLAAIGVYFWLTPKSPNTETKKVYHIGILSGLDFFADTIDGFKEKMTELGYVEGQNVIYDVQKRNFDMTSYDTVLKKFVADKVDLIFVFPTEASQQAKIDTEGTGIPVVFANAFTDDTGLVNSVKEPGGNLTGVRWAGPDLALQRFEIMRDLAPKVKRMFIPYQNGYPIVKSQLEALRPKFASAGITLVEIPADNATDLESQLKQQEELLNSGTDAILMISEPLCVTPDDFVVISKFAEKYNIPYGGAYMAFGGYTSIFGATPQNIPQGRQAAILADKILKGMPAGTIPVISADAYFQLNYTIAQKFGLTVSESLLNRADEIIR